MDDENIATCQDCDKHLISKIKSAQCSNCKVIFCKNHSRLGTKRQIICRKCYKCLLKKEIAKDYLAAGKYLSNALSVAREQEAVAKLDLGKKNETRKRLIIQLQTINDKHIETINTIENNINCTQNSNQYLENAAFSLKFVLSDLQQRVVEKKSEVILTLNALDALFKEKLQLNYEIETIAKMIQTHHNKKQLFIHYTKLPIFCCASCLEKVKLSFSNQVPKRRNRHKPPKKNLRKIDKSSIQSLPNPDSNACVCSIY